MNDIDGDDDDDVMSDEANDEVSTVDGSDADSILAMARRLDDASVLSDPSFIEGTSPHRRGAGPPSYSSTGHRPHPYGGGAGGGGGMYGGRGRLDSIASESDDDDDDDDEGGGGGGQQQR